MVLGRTADAGAVHRRHRRCRSASTRCSAETGGGTDPRNFAGSSGATYFLAATLAAALLLRSRVSKERLLAAGVPVLGLALWFAQDNGHGLVTAYGFVLGALVWGLGRRMIRPERLRRSPQEPANS